MLDDRLEECVLVCCECVGQQLLVGRGDAGSEDGFDMCAACLAGSCGDDCRGEEFVGEGLVECVLDCAGKARMVDDCDRVRWWA